MLESEIKDKCKKWLDKNGWFSFNVHQQGMYCHRGISDRIAVKDGQVVFIEYKTDKGKQNEYQKEFQKQLTEAGGRYIIVRSVEELIFELEGFKQLTFLSEQRGKRAIR